MHNQHLLVILDANASIVAVADPSKAPPGMGYSIRAKNEHLVYEVQAPAGLMQYPHKEMKRIIAEQIEAGACKPHLSGRVMRRKSA